MASPTASNEAILGTFMIDAHEGREIGIFSIPGAYLRALMKHDKNKVVMVLCGIFVDLMCEVDQKYKKYIKIINGKKVLYLKVLRAIYRCIQSALLWYKLFTTMLKEMVFL